MRFFNLPNATDASERLDSVSASPVSFLPRAVDKPLVLYGAGNLGKMAKEYFDRLGLPVQYVVDARPEVCRADPFWRGVQVRGPHELQMDEKSSCLLAVCLVSEPFSQLQVTLSAAGWRDVVPFYDVTEAYRDRHPLGNGWSIDALDNARTRDVLSRWTDDVSRAHHLQFIAWHRLREDWIFTGAPLAGERYFIPEVCRVLNDREVFVDVGAHYGEVSVRFLDIVKHCFQGLWAIEPDQGNILHLRQTFSGLSSEDRAKISVLDCAVGQSGDHTCFFEGLGYASQLSNMGQSELEVRTIDQLNLQPSLIKLHVEGWELRVLEGGMATVQRHRPIMIATAYHNDLGVWQLPKWLMDNMPDYSFFFRLHNWCGTGSVVYAIPNERNVL